MCYCDVLCSMLPAREQENRESVNAFAQRVQYEVAKELDLAPTQHSNADKVEYAKREKFIANSGSLNHSLTH